MTTRIAVLAATLMLSALTPAMAQSITASERTACKADYDKYCRGTFPGGGRIIRCLEKQYARLAAPCKKVVNSYKKK